MHFLINHIKINHLQINFVAIFRAHLLKEHMIPKILNHRRLFLQYHLKNQVQVKQYNLFEQFVHQSKLKIFYILLVCNLNNDNTSCV
jgi:hypothetical protein